MEIPWKVLFAGFRQQNNTKNSTTNWRDVCLSLITSLSFTLIIKNGAAVNKVYRRTYR